jgi:hypothetical protein
MKLGITGDLQSSDVLELNDAELAFVSGGHDHEHWHSHGDWHFHGHWNSWGGDDCWQDGPSYSYDDCGSQQQVIFVAQQSSPCLLVPSSSCGWSSSYSC